MTRREPYTRQIVLALFAVCLTTSTEGSSAGQTQEKTANAQSTHAQPSGSKAQHPDFLWNPTRASDEEAGAANASETDETGLEVSLGSTEVKGSRAPKVKDTHKKSKKKSKTPMA